MSRRTVAGPKSVRENTLEDVDGDTKVQVEESTDEDKIRFDTAGVERMVITDAGAVGIGTSSPDNTLHVKSPGTTHIKIESDAGSEAALKLKSGNEQSAYVWQPGNTSDLRFYVGGADRMHIDNNGNVGIGTTDPSDLLTINAAADGDECFIQFKEAGVERAKIGINTANNLVFHQQFMNKHIVFKVNDQGVTREGIRLNGAVPEVVINEQHGINGDDSLVDFRVESDSNTHMLFVDGSADKIGINTNTPKSSLSINGSLALNVLGINSVNDPGTTYTVQGTECVILISTRDTGEGGINSDITLTLPDASDNPGRVLTIKDAGGYCDVVGRGIVLNTSSGDNFDGNPVTTSISLPSAASFKKLISDGALSWYEIGN